MTPEERADPIVARLVEAFTGKTISVGDFRCMVAAAIREAEQAVWEEAAKFVESQKMVDIFRTSETGVTIQEVLAEAMRNKAKDGE